MTLGTFTPKTRVAGDKIDLRNSANYNVPYLMQAVDYSDSFFSKMANNGAGANIEAVWADVLDCRTGRVYVNALFTAGNIVDNLKATVGSGTVLPVKIVRQTGGKFGGYAVLAELDPSEMAAANNAYQHWGMVAQERARREAAAQAAGANQPNQGFGQQQAPQFQGQQPVQAGGFGAPQQNQFQQQAPAQGFGQPAQGQGFAPAGTVNNQFTDPNAMQYQQQAAPQGQAFGQPAQGAQSAAAFQGQGMNPAQAQQAVAGQYQQQAPAQGFSPAEAGSQFGAPAQQFQGQPAQQGSQFGVPAQQPQGQPAFGAPQQGGFGAPQVPQGQAPDAAAQNALAQLNGGQFS